MSNPIAANDLSSMRIFVAEFLSGGGMLNTPVDAIAPSLLSEGELMWRALVEDFSKWAQVRTPVDPRLGLHHDDTAQIETVSMQACQTPWAQWIDAARGCDACVVIIPESDGLLSDGIATLRASGAEVLAPSETAIHLASDKWETAKWLHQAGVAHPDTWALGHRRDGQAPSYLCSQRSTAGRGKPTADCPPRDGYLVKPRDGCGAANIILHDELEPALASMNPSEITQQRLGGRPASVTVIGNHTTGHNIVLPAVWQSIDQRTGSRCESHATAPGADGSSPSDLVYRGGSGPVPAEFQTRAHALAERVIRAMPGKISGFIGIDLILGDDSDRDAVIEVNPRLTTSYTGLRRIIGENLTQRLFGPSTHHPAIGVPTESVVWQIA